VEREERSGAEGVVGEEEEEGGEEEERREGSVREVEDGSGEEVRWGVDVGVRDEGSVMTPSAGGSA
jgi:hypothetical protein